MFAPHWLCFTLEKIRPWTIGGLKSKKKSNELNGVCPELIRVCPDLIKVGFELILVGFELILVYSELIRVSEFQFIHKPGSIAN